MHKYVSRVPHMKPIRPEYLAAVLDELADDDALFFADTGTACTFLDHVISNTGVVRLLGLGLALPEDVVYVGVAPE
jgi:pyruvate dehydrogenase (quinone)